MDMVLEHVEEAGQSARFIEWKLHLEAVLQYVSVRIWGYVRLANGADAARGKTSPARPGTMMESAGALYTGKGFLALGSPP